MGLDQLFDGKEITKREFLKLTAAAGGLMVLGEGPRYSLRQKRGFQ